MSRLAPFNVYFFCSLCLFFITGCQLTSTEDNAKNKNNKRSTLLDLAKAQPDALLGSSLDKSQLTKKKRAEKLAEIYQSILVLSPDPEVRVKIEYRLVQLDSENYENIDFEKITSAEMDKELNLLVVKYQQLLIHYPNRADNELIQYQLAKALDLQGKLDESLQVIETLLVKYPKTQYFSELNFRRGEIYYNFADYASALIAYQKVVTVAEPDINSQKYYLNSLYMSGWSLFKLDQLAQAGSKFIKVIELVINESKRQYSAIDFSFEQLNSRHVNLAVDAQRILTISLSQQQQSTSLLALVTQELQNKQSHIYLYQHILFKNLADFLIEKELIHEAEKTYLTYINAKDELTVGASTSAYYGYSEVMWSARFSLELLKLYKQQGKYSDIEALKKRYVIDYGLSSEFFTHASNAEKDELLPHLLSFSYQQSRVLYAKAQSLKKTQLRVDAFAKTAIWLNRYLTLAKLSISQKFIGDVSQSIMADEFLYADASFEAHSYQKALNSYQRIAYQKSDKSYRNNLTEKVLVEKEIKLQREAAYATTLTIREIILQEEAKKLADSGTKKTTKDEDVYQSLLVERVRLDKLFINTYPKDNRAFDLATHGAQYAYNRLDFYGVQYYSDFVLNHYGADAQSVALHKQHPQLSAKSLKQVRVVSQLQANSFYKLANYEAAESGYSLALRYVKKEDETWAEMNELLASCIYFQGQSFHQQLKQLSLHSPEVRFLSEQALQQYLRIFAVSNSSQYALTGLFDAANLLLDQQMWQRAANALLVFKKRYPLHEYSATIPAKLAKSYEATKQWELAAEQLLLMANQPITNQSNGIKVLESSSALKREAQYTAGQYYVKAGNIPKAIITFRAYAHKYPQPFAIAQEVRFKLSEFYQTTNQVNKQYFWYRKIVSYHDVQVGKNTKQVSPNELSRSTYLASVAALGLGKAHQQTFKWTKLKIPLNKTLKAKQKAMQLAIGYYQKLLSYQLAEFVPNATFNLAEMYRQLAMDVMASQRPVELDELALEEYEMLLEEIAYPFEEKAIEVHASNAERAWQDVFDVWVAKSFAALAKLDPVQYNKQERVVHAVLSLH